eukprot:TRINITY_DN105075_c0_g1_i1.p1 TRINITY_DN105075_c0_g1~~TRINITY_DN105075_c0_g1_i1.p1  ORF type:complete len:695 (-),score=114.80 TRINITY_DN105075_c0_g1_i1:44-2128(-)
MNLHCCKAVELMLGCMVSAALSQAEKQTGLGCTAVAVSGQASSDGSAFAGMNADSSSCDGRVAYIPSADHPPGSMRPLYIFKGTAPRFIGYGRGAFYEPKEGEKLSPKLGEVPQVRRTFAYWEAALPLMNEKGLALGESSCASRLMNYPIGRAPPGGDPRTGAPATEGALDLTNMMQIALERCADARCGVEVMGNLAEEYGFFPMVGDWSLGREADTGKVAFDDGGEAITLSDRFGAAWVFHVVGGVTGVAKSVWAAMRLPPGHVAFVANNFVLREVPQQPGENWLFSPKLREAALVSGFWDGHEPFDFSRVFAPDSVFFEAPEGAAPIPLYASLRLWRLFGLAAPKAYAKKPLPLDPLELPLSVAAEKKLDARDVFAFLSDTYEGTEFDMSQGILAGPFGSPFPREGGNNSRLGQIPRGISIARTLYSVVGQSRLYKQPVVWLAADSPVASVYVPFYPAAGEKHATAYSTGTMGNFTRESAWWAFDFVANWASNTNWRHATTNFIFPLREKLQRMLLEDIASIEARAEKEGSLTLLGEWQMHAQQAVVDRWWRLADELVVAYNDGFFNDASHDKFGVGLGYPEWWAQQIGFNQDVHPIYVKRDLLADESYAADAKLQPPGFVAAVNPLPTSFSFTQKSWQPHVLIATAWISLGGINFVLAIVATFVLGILTGRATKHMTSKDLAIGSAYVVMP